jgi:hypothetical protein
MPSRNHRLVIFDVLACDGRHGEHYAERRAIFDELELELERPAGYHGFRTAASVRPPAPPTFPQRWGSHSH